MQEYCLTFDSEDGHEEISLETGRVSFGRGSDADFRFPDDGLSRLHATVYSEAGKIWVVDENSSNGTFVNGSRVGGNGQPLAVGDVIKIGHHTNIHVAAVIAVQESASPAAAAAPVTTSAGDNMPASAFILPLVIIGIALLIIVPSAVVIGYSYLGPDTAETSSLNNTGDDEDSGLTDEPSASPSPGAATPAQNGNLNTNDTASEATPEPGGTPFPVLPSKQYKAMTPEEKNLYIKIKAEKVAQLIGNRSSGEIPPAAIASIKSFVEPYTNRFRSSRTDDCSSRSTFGRSDMTTVLERASKNVPYITRSFRTQAVDPQVGIYVAMIESEHCVCLQSPTGPLGMFQFTKATGEAFGLNTFNGASPSNPDERCKPEQASLASAKYLKYLSGRIGTGPLSVPLAIASYNSGEGGLGKNLMTALTADSSEERSFWTLVANAEKLSKQFKNENIKYVPKFFAVAIIGENPRDFGVDMQALSSYTR